MDENDFRQVFGRKSAFKNMASLDKSWIPEKLYCRDEVVNTLIVNFRRILEEPEQPTTNCVILGKGGVGKTTTAKYFGQNFKTIALENNVNLFLEYYDCINFRSKSKIIRELLGKYTHGSGRGFSDDEALKLILTKLIRDNGYMLLIIDEVHMLKPVDILSFLNIAETFGHKNAKISIILISRVNDWMKIENERILSRLNQKIKLSPYNEDEAMQILQYRSDIAFKDGAIDEDTINLVAKIVVANKNMRHGIDILQKSGLYADKEGFNRITADIIRKASNDVYPTFRADVIDELNDQELLALYGIAQSLINSEDTYTLVDDAYVEYQTICESYEQEAHVKMSFRKYVRQLSQLKIITSKTVRIEDAQRGRHLEITLLDIPAPKLEELLKDICERKFS